MDVQEILKMYNDNGMKLEEIAERFNSSKSTISRVLRDNGYVFDKALKQYILKDVNTGIIENVNNVPRETINTGNNKEINTIKCTFDLPVKLHRELKSKCALEGIKMVDFVRNILQEAIEK